MATQPGKNMLGGGFVTRHLNNIRTVFNRHLVEQNETYLQHLRASFSLAGKLGLSCLYLLIHGLLPPVAPRTGGDILLDASHDLVRRRRASPKPPAQGPA